MTEFSALDVLRREDIQMADRLWVVLRPQMLGGLFDTACGDIAEHVLGIYESSHPGDTRVRACVKAIRRYARGEMDKENLLLYADAARSAADEADVEDFVLTVASAAAESVAIAAYLVATRGENRGVARFISSTAIATGFSSTELRWQIQHIVEMLEAAA